MLLWHKRHRNTVYALQRRYTKQHYFRATSGEPISTRAEQTPASTAILNASLPSVIRCISAQLRRSLRDMTITADVFAAYLKCPTKCFLRAHGEAGSGNEYADWFHAESEMYRAEGLWRVMAGIPPDDCVTGESAMESIRTAKWRFAVDRPGARPESGIQDSRGRKDPARGAGKGRSVYPGAIRVHEQTQRR